MIIGPGLTLVGSLLLVRVAVQNLKALGIDAISAVIWGRLRSSQGLTKAVEGTAAADVRPAAIAAKAEIVGAKANASSEKLESLRNAVKEWQSLTSDDAFGAAAVEASQEMLSPVGGLRRTLGRFGLGAIGLQRRTCAQAKQIDALRGIGRERRDKARRDRAP